MIQSHVIDIGGTFAGAAVRTAKNFRFIAVDPRVEELDQSEWPSLADIRRVVGHVLRVGHLPELQPTSRSDTVGATTDS